MGREGKGVCSSFHYSSHLIRAQHANFDGGEGRGGGERERGGRRV